VNFSPVESTLATVGGGLVRLWDVVSGELIRSVAGLGFAAFSPEGNTIAAASATHFFDVLLYDSKSGTLRLGLLGHTGDIFAFSFSGSKLGPLGSSSSQHRRTPELVL